MVYWEWLGLAVTSGAVAGASKHGFDLLRDWLAGRRARDAQASEQEHQGELQTQQLNAQRDLQREERRHQAQLRREHQFAEAAPDCLDAAKGVREWVNAEWFRNWGAEFDLRPVDVATPSLGSAAAVTGALSRLSVTHPSVGVRREAYSLASHIEDASNSNPDDYGDTNIGPEMYRAWGRRCNELIEAIHSMDHELHNSMYKSIDPYCESAPD